MSLATLAEIGIKALRLQDAADKKRKAREVLRRAYSAYRGQHAAGGFLHKESTAYNRMLTATDREYDAYQLAQREVANARRSLETACKRAAKELAAGASAETAVRRIMEKAS